MTPLEAALASARGLLLLAEALVFGSLAVQAMSGRAPGAAWQHRAAWLLLAVSGVAWIVLQSVEIADAATLGALRDVLGLTLVGHVWLARLVLWGLAWLARRHARVAVGPAAAAMALHAASGHAAASGDPVPLASVLAHVTAAGAWIGGLPALWLGLIGPEPGVLLRRFSRMGLVCVLVLAGTALVQADALAGGLPGLVGTGYGHLLLVKATLFVALIGLALRNQFRLSRDVLALRRSVVVEAALGVATLLTASLLSGLPPGAHEQPDWPFAWRISLDALDDGGLRAELVGACLALLGAVGMAVIAVRMRRVRWSASVGAAAIVWCAVPHLSLLLVPAEPTVFWQAPTGPSPASIAAGAGAYAANCVGCHGAGGRGDGPLAAGLAVPPADLTAAHLWDHPDGELFWWITDGMDGPDGASVMPGFRDRLDPDLRWAVIDFLHANNPNGAARPGVRHQH